MKLDCRRSRAPRRQARRCLMLSIPLRELSMATRVFVDGQEGTTGLRINEYLARRSDVEVLRAAPELRKDAGERARLLNAADVAFLCLPDAAAREAVALVTNPKTCLIDASTAHRTASDWVFGLPELAADQRARIRASKRIANPGCHSTGFILLVRPLVDAGLVSSAALLSATLDHRLLRRRQEDDRAVRGRRRSAPGRAAPLRPQAQPQAPARDDGAQPARDGADLHADRRQLPEGPVGRGAAAPVDAQARHDGRAAARGARASAMPASASFASCRSATRRRSADGYFDVQACNDTQQRRAVRVRQRRRRCC